MKPGDVGVLEKTIQTRPSGTFERFCRSLAHPLGLFGPQKIENTSTVRASRFQKQQPSLIRGQDAEARVGNQSRAGTTVDKGLKEVSKQAYTAALILKIESIRNFFTRLRRQFLIPPTTAPSDIFSVSVVMIHPVVTLKMAF
jgi:hypothetical protein